MAKPSDIRKIRVMISSRAMTPVFGGDTLSSVRTRLQHTLHRIRWSTTQAPGAKARGIAGRDQALFDVWIHETHPGDAGDLDTLQISLREIGRADIVLVLYTGEAGSAAHEREIGICHAELLEALTRRPEIVSLVGIEPLIKAETSRDRSFQEYVNSRGLYTPQGIDSYDKLEAKVLELLQHRIAVLASRGASTGSRKRDRGEALDWNRLDLASRQQAMGEALDNELNGTAAKGAALGEVLRRIALPSSATIVARLDAIPAALSVAAARERVGQPFLRDHRHVGTIKALKAPGIVHIVACHRGITESQALKILGSPDAMAVSSDFGVYAADQVQQIQMIFLANCADRTATALTVRRLREWLSQSGEQARILHRAEARRRILEVIAEELARTQG